MEMTRREKKLLKYGLVWAKQGKECKKKREQLNISLKEMAEAVGCCTQTLRKYERGGNVRSRRLFDADYENALLIIPLRRMLNAGQFKMNNGGINNG